VRALERERGPVRVECVYLGAGSDAVRTEGACVHVGIWVRRAAIGIAGVRMCAWSDS